MTIALRETAVFLRDGQTVNPGTGALHPGVVIKYGVPVALKEVVIQLLAGKTVDRVQ